VQIIYDPAKQEILAPVHFEVEPERIVGIGRHAVTDVGAAVDMLVGRGMRATLQSANLLTGQMLVALEFVPDAPPATVTRQDGAFVIPTSDSGSISGLEASAAELLRKVNSIPFDSLGRNLDQTTAGLNDLVNGAQMKQLMTSLNTTLSSARDMVRNLDAGLTPTMKKLPDIAANLQKTMTDANGLVLSLQSGYGDNTQFNRDLDHLMIQLNDAVRSIRSLADLLERHPEALIKGRAAGGVE
jgi:paraquat-inducible protein B